LIVFAKDRVPEDESEKRCGTCSRGRRKGKVRAELLQCNEGFLKAKQKKQSVESKKTKLGEKKGGGEADL